MKRKLPKHPEWAIGPYGNKYTLALRARNYEVIEEHPGNRYRAENRYRELQDKTRSMLGVIRVFNTEDGKTTDGTSTFQVIKFPDNL